jgi:hypothetical protein
VVCLQKVPLMDETLSVSADASEAGPLEAPPEEAITQRKMEDALRAISQSWLSKINQSQRHKKPFTDDAREAMNFFDGHGDWFWKDGKGAGESNNSRIAPPSFRMAINKAFEAVKLFGSVIYHRNPVRTVTPRAFPVVPPTALGIDPNQPPQMDPMTGQPMPNPMVDQFIQVSNQIGMMDDQRRTIADMMEAYLNYTPVELNLKENSRQAVDEGIIKGMGVWWTELVELPTTEDGQTFGLIGSFYDSVDNLEMDPDADNQEDILWCARRCIHPVDEVARQYGLNREDLKGHLESYVSQSEENTRDYKHRKRNGKTNDLIVYWKIWSKTGFGHTLKGFPKEHAGMFDALGQNCYLVIAEGVNYPLNAPKEIALEEPDESGLPNTLFTRTRWPIPFYADINGWPFTPLQFHRKPGYIWPISHLKPGMGELKFLNWAMSFLAGRVMVSCKTMVGVAKAAGDDIKDQILKHEENGFSLVELSETLGRSVTDIVSVFQLPEVSPEIWKILQAVSDMFDKRVGLTELVFGMTRNQFRSAAEAQVKSEQISVRPDDMANVLEDSMSALARKEALAARWLLQPQDVAPVLGPLGAEVWSQQIQQMDVHALAREFDYRIEAGSARKPNKAGRVEQMNMAVQTLGPILQGLIPMGQVAPMNALLSDWCKALDIDPKPYMIPPPPPPPPGPSGPLPPDAQEGEQPPPGDGGGGALAPDQIPPEMSPMP